MSALLMVSGASRGLGRAIAVAFAESPLLASPKIVETVLLARSSMEETTRAMKAARPSWPVYSYSVDLGNLKTLEETMEPILERHAGSSTISTEEEKIVPSPTALPPLPSQPRAILINCAGTLGYIGRLPTSLREIQQATDLNFTSKAWLTARFLGAFPHNSIVVNVSSMCAVKPTPTMALYCATSAAREMFHTVVAQDVGPAASDDKSNHTQHPRILNYSPGSCNTDMQAQLRQHDNLDPSVQAYCHSLVVDGGGIVACEESAAELTRLVLGGNFRTGERVEYTDSSTYKY